MTDTMHRSTMAQSGPQDLMWVNATTNLDAFKDQKKQNEARRHVMKDYLKKENTTGRRATSEKRSTTSPDAQEPLKRDQMFRLVGAPTSSIQSQRQLISPSPTVADHPSPAYTLSDTIVQSPAHSNASSTRTTDEEVEAVLRYYASQQTNFTLDQFMQQFDGRLVNKVETYEFESVTFKNINTLPRISVGKPTDPFNAMPEGFTPSFDVQYIKYHCIRYFATGMTKTWWAPLSNVSLHSFFSNLYLCAVHLDVMKDTIREPQITTALRADSIIRISRCTLAGDIGDSVIQSIVHVILVDLINGDLTPLQFHEEGIKRIVGLRGGLGELGMGGVLANTLSIVAFMSAIHRETKADQLYHAFIKTLPNIKPPRDRLVPESPLYAPYTNAYKTFLAPGCQSHTYSLLISMREITDLFLSETNIPHPTALLRIQDIHNQTLALPSADIPNTPYSNDMVYEACRLTSCIYVIAIQNRIPLSEACARVPIPPSMLHHPSSSGHHVLEALRFAVRASNRGQCWLNFNMTGVFYWITLVAGAAGSKLAVRHETLAESWPREFQERAKSARARNAGVVESGGRGRASLHRAERARLQASRSTTQSQTPYSPGPVSESSSSSRPPTRPSTSHPELSTSPTLYYPTPPPPTTRFLRKWFAALSMQSMALLAFQHPAPVLRASWRMARVVESCNSGGERGGRITQ